LHLQKVILYNLYMVDSWAIETDLTTGQTPALMGGFSTAVNKPASETTPPTQEMVRGKPNGIMQFFMMMQNLFNGEGGFNLSALFNSSGGFNGQGMLNSLGNILNSDFAAVANSGHISSPQLAVSNLPPILDNKLTEADVSPEWVQDTRQGFVDQMRSLVGRTEMGGDNNGVSDITGAFNRAPWCASLVTNQIAKFFPGTITGAHCLTIKAQMEQAGAFDAAVNGHIPEVGDTWFKERGTAYDNKAHMGVVASVDLENGTYTVIEGNVGVAKGVDGVRENTYSLDDFAKDRVLGFGNTADAYLARNEATPDMMKTAPETAPVLMADASSPVLQTNTM
jgi:hypothetical protein